MSCGSDHPDFAMPQCECHGNKVMDKTCRKRHRKAFCKAIRDTRDRTMTAMVAARQAYLEALAGCYPPGNQVCVTAAKVAYANAVSKLTENYGIQVANIKGAVCPNMISECCKEPTGGQ